MRYLKEITGTEVKLTLSNEGALSSSSFLYSGTAESMADRINKKPHRFIERAGEKGGWLLLHMSDCFFEMLIEEGRRLPYSPRGDYAEKRLELLMRHGRLPCPRDAKVRLLLIKGALGRLSDLELLSISHHLDGMDRVCLEHSLGGVAEALMHYRARLREEES